MTKEAKLILSISIAVIIGIVFLMAFGPQESATTKIANQSSLLDHAIHMTGSKDAKVTIVEFGDYQCPACGVAYPIVKKVIDAYGKNPDFNFVFRNFPLSQHQNAPLAAEAAEAAGAQGKFWEMHDLLYQNQNEWADSKTPMDFFITYAQQLKLNITKFKNEVESAKYDSIIQTDQSDGSAVNVEWTPTFYINGERQEQMPTLDQFKSKIDNLLKK